MFFLDGSHKAPFSRIDGNGVKYCLNLKNGMLDPENPEFGLRSHSPDVFSTCQHRYEYNPEAKCPKFMAYLETVQPDEEARKHLAMLMGLSLVPGTSYNVFFILYGEGGTGKSVFLHVLQHLVGMENVCSLALTQFTNRFAMVELTEKLLNILSDLPTDDGHGNTLAHVEGMLKMVTSGRVSPHREERSTGDLHEPCRGPIDYGNQLATTFCRHQFRHLGQGTTDSVQCACPWRNQ